MTSPLDSEVQCILYDGRTPVAQPAVLCWEGTELHVRAGAQTRRYAASALQLSGRSGRADRFVRLPDGAQLQCADHARLDALARDGTAERLLQALDRRWSGALACLALLIACLTLGYTQLLPAIATRIAAKVPPEYERRLGDTSLEWMERQGFFTASSLEQPRRGALQDRFAQLVQGLPVARFARLDFRAAPTLGANALALPGGIIVVTDAMVAACKSPEELMIVLAHELGHVEHRHVLRTVLQRSGAAALASTFTADLSGLGLTISGLPLVLLGASYSRELEAEADRFAFDLALRHGLPVDAFALVMDRLNDAGDEGPHMSFLDSHPAGQERSAQARSVASGPGKEFSAPQWKVGDRWLYVALDGELPAHDEADDPEEAGWREWVVTRQQQVDGVDHYVLVADEGAQTRTVRRSDLALASDGHDEGRTDTRFNPPLQEYTWPLRDGLSWTASSIRAAQGQRRPTRVALQCQVDTPGITKVPVGEFNTLRVACVDANTRALVSERWYAPAIRHVVLDRAYENGAPVSAWALADYELH